MVQLSGHARRPGPLDGVRVLDFSQIAAGPFCSSLLGDLGADVVTVEPRSGEPFRSIDNLFGPNESAYHFGVNRSKRSVTLDLSTEASRAVVDRLVTWADVVLISFRGAAVAKLGLDFERLSAVNPRLVYCWITAFGETGPMAGEPGMDILAQALGVTMSLTGEPDRPPVKVGPPIADFTVSYLAGFAICAALRARDRDGVGDKISINLLDGQIASNANFVTPYMKTGVPMKPLGGGHPQLVPYQVFRASDAYFVLACLNDRFWPPLCRAIGREEWIHDPSYATNVERVRRREELVPEFEALFATATVEHWLSTFRENGIPCSRVNRIQDAVVDPQVVNNEMIVELEHPEHGSYSVVNTPFRFAGMATGISRPVSDLGQHTDEVLREIGFDGTSIHELHDNHVV